MTDCSIIIPMFNQAALTRQCLAAVARTTPPGTEVIVVDDASTETLPIPGVRVIRHDANAGFAQSCNDGAAAAGGRHLVFLNNDTLPQPGWLEALTRYADAHPKASVIGAKLLYPAGTIQHAGVVICQDRYPRHIYAGFPAEHPAVNKSRRFPIVTAACALVRRAAFEKVAGFDTAYRNGFEDVELCLRLGELGHEIHYCHGSVVTHLESVSEGRFRNAKHNVKLYRQRWLDRVQPDDLRYYVEDDLLRVTYEGQYPVHLAVSPLLAVMGDAHRETERALQQRNATLQQLQRENVRLRVELGRVAPSSPELQYQQLREAVIEAVRSAVPPDASVLVVSKGDDALLRLDGRRAQHFPQTDSGTYAGHHPADGTEAIAHLEALRQRGAQYLVLPATAFWWLDAYEGFREHLETHGSEVARLDCCRVFALRQDTQS